MSIAVLINDDQFVTSVTLLPSFENTLGEERSELIKLT
jgi:hypothetical protein